LIKLLKKKYQIVSDRGAMAMSDLAAIYQEEKEPVGIYASRILKLVEECRLGRINISNNTAAIYFLNGMSFKLQQKVKDKMENINLEAKDVSSVLLIAEKIESNDRSTSENSNRLRRHLKPRDQDKFKSKTDSTNKVSQCKVCKIKEVSPGYDTCSIKCSKEFRKSDKNKNTQSENNNNNNSNKSTIEDDKKKENTKSTNSIKFVDVTASSKDIETTRVNHRIDNNSANPLDWDTNKLKEKELCGYCIKERKHPKPWCSSLYPNYWASEIRALKKANVTIPKRTQQP
jgi:hypothetical protein